MTTKLEAMVGLLAGRKVEPELLEELADPSSEASRFLEATRVRSRALLAEPGLLGKPKRTREGRGGIILFAILAVAVLSLFAATIWLVDRRFRVLEASLSARDSEARADARRIEAILQRLSESGPGFERIEDELATLEKDLATMAHAPADPGFAQIRDQIASLRRELSTIDKMSTERTEVFQAEVHDASRLIKLLLTRIESLTTDPDPPAGFKTNRPTVPADNRRLKP